MRQFFAAVWLCAAAVHASAADMIERVASYLRAPHVTLPAPRT